MNFNQKRAFLREALITGDPELEDAILNNPYFAVEFDNFCHLLPAMVRGIYHEAKYSKSLHKELMDKIMKSIPIDPILLSNGQDKTNEH